MMDRGQYLAAALNALGSPSEGASPGGMDPAAMLRVKQQRAAWEEQNPGKSYAMNGLHQLSQSLGLGGK